MNTQATTPGQAGTDESAPEPSESQAWSSRQARAELERFLVRDLLGPWAGDTEELPAGTIPSERYILGVLSPARVSLDAEVTDDTASDDGSGEGAAEVTAAAAAGSMAPASLGLSFSLPLEISSVRVRASWGRYVQGESATDVTDAGAPRLVWRRESAGGSVDLDVTEPESTEVPDPEQPGVVVRARCRPQAKCRVVDVAIVNAQPEPPDRKDAAKIFQVRIEVTALDGHKAVFLPHNDPSHVVADETAPGTDLEVQGLAMLYRRARQFAVGRNAGVDVDQRPGDGSAWRVATTNMPAYEVEQTVAPAPAQVPQLTGLEVDMRTLATAPRTEVLAALRPLTDGYLQWLEEQDQRLASDPTLTGHGVAAHSHLRDAREAARRIAVGIDLLGADEKAWQAWQFANLAMAMQREHTEIAAERAKNPDLTLAAAAALVDEPRRRSWRPFQLAFVLLNLPSLTDPAHPDRALAGATNGPGMADLLFFPTGGGKTEAYLGLTAFTLAIRRLQGVIGEGADARDGRAGVAVLMRYTLRLLTAQQFQRAATLICAAEQLRRTAAAAQHAGGPLNPWGEEPFRIGLWVGSKVTPNWYDQAKSALDAMRHRYAGAGATNPIQVLACPWCGRDIEPGQDAECDDSRRRVLVWCGDPDGLCAFSRKQSTRWGEGLPVVTVDEEVFRLAPSLVIGTVDKFAQLPLRGQTGLLFGRTSSWCERHGYRHPDLTRKTDCKDGGHPRRGTQPGTKPQNCGPLRPPDLIIQDELHLISGALGTMVGLYETAVDRLAGWSVNGTTIRPKVVASTATVRRAKEQVHGLFNRDLAIFPAPVLDAGETFFSTQIPVDDNHPGRRYLGVCAHGQRLKQVQIRVAQLLLAAGQLLFDEHGDAADPYMTLVDYFSSTTELAGMRRLVDDDISTRLRQQARRGLRDRRNLEVRELTARINSQDIGKALSALANPFDPDIDSSAAKATAARLRKESRAGGGKTPEARAARAELDALPRHEWEKKPIDVLLATSMLQVGVDVSRLGLMVVTGQPKNSAEYIQASSRVGRDPSRPGLVVTLFNWARPRDLGHLETFTHFHETFYARVEPLSVTPFADRALDRGLAAVLVAALRHAREDWESEPDAHAVPVTDPDVDAAIEWISERAGDVLGDAVKVAEIENMCRALLDDWDRRRKGLEVGGLSYTSDRNGLDPLLDSGVGRWGTWSAGWSLREVEPETNLLINLAAPEVANRPEWAFGDGSGPAVDDEDEDETEPADEAGLLTAQPVPAAEGEPHR
ncbi:MULTISPECIES: DISARM system helicase DrmA [Rhodococcus]|uniref:DISARM system helicase DrmA n=1 Tax=Rhodococcus TaxID=1827 RepID=UPI0029535B46|nr:MULTISPECIES: DISARM system helicase DrmA [Rhodococcus]MDV7246235.1 DISARM system helicase DrmA [Rhodococcus oxybenzonivorans]MDV7337293.1 DISARM system helicase DrmA [Rhodococcus oxybenzonivorans]MDV8030719.1 DISARM system helicase DrmA [Rhodococcus sp. IEGM 27]